MPIIRTTHDLTFEAAEGESLLDAALRAGITLPYSCRTGRCSTCRCRVDSGTTRALHEETGLTPEERAEGWILSCVRSASEDLLLEVEDLGGIDLTPPRTQPCRIQSMDSLAPDVLRVTLRLPPAVDVAHQPGQYIDVIGPGGVRRSYSIANASRPDRTLELQVRKVDGGEMSSYWFERAATNDLLRLHGPLGTFFLRDVTGADLVFLATGTGIAPIKAILESLDRDPGRRPGSISLYWGGRQPADLYWQPPAKVADVPVRYVPVLSRAGEDWDGARGHVQDAMLASTPMDSLARARVYACGSDAMIHGARAALTAAGLLDRHFHADAFVCSAAA